MIQRLWAQFSRISLTKRFAILSLIILLAGMLVIGWWVTREIESGVMNRTASVTASFVTSFVSPHLQGLSESGELSPEQMETLDGLLFDTELGKRIVSFKVWASDGRVLYSPQRDLVGKWFEVGAALAQALAGKTVSHISNLGAPENLYERRRFSKLVETYTPWRSPGTGEILGAVEFYEGTEALAEEIRGARVRSWFVVVGSTAAMYVLLVGTIKGAGLTIRRQQEERARLMRELSRIQAQREVDKIKAEFISAVSHELRTPLGFIKGYATTLLRDDITVEPTTRREFLQIIEEESDKLQRMIDELLDASRLQAGKLEISRRAVPLSEIIESALRKVSPGIEERGYVVTVRPTPEEAVVFADPMRIEQVLYNLLDNAAQYSDPGSRIEIASVLQGQVSVVSVKDEGDGIPPEELKNIFEPFYRGANTKRRANRGTGIGLSISLGIIEAHGGRLWAESTPGIGSTFLFTVPLANSVASTALEEQEPPGAVEQGGVG